MKHSLYKLLKKIFYSLRLLHLFLYLERVLGWKRSVISLCYHSTPEMDPAQPISLLEGGTSQQRLENQIRIFSRWLQPIDDHQLVDWFSQKTPWRRDGLLVTFDDGYKNNQTIAGPILQAHKVPGLIFIPTHFISSGTDFWWSRISDVMRAITPEQWEALRNQRLPVEILQILTDENVATWPNRVKARRRIADWLNRNNAPHAVLEIFETATTSSNNPDMALLTWNEIETLQSANTFHFGSHTHNHPVLTQLSKSELRSELQTGRDIFEQHLGSQPISLAYPGGHVDPDVENQAAEVGFQIAFTTQQGMIYRSTNRLRLPRLYLKFSKPYEIYFALTLIKLAKYLPRKIEPRMLRLAR